MSLAVRYLAELALTLTPIWPSSWIRKNTPWWLVALSLFVLFFIIIILFLFYFIFHQTTDLSFLRVKKNKKSDLYREIDEGYNYTVI